MGESGSRALGAFEHISRKGLQVLISLIQSPNDPNRTQSILSFLMKTLTEENISKVCIEY